METRDFSSLTAETEYDPLGEGGFERLIERILACLENAKASDIMTIPLKGKSSVADAMILASGRSSRHITAVSEMLVTDLKKNGYAPLGVEGAQQGDWVLIDAGDVIVHLFRPEVRTFYALDKMWAPADPMIRSSVFPDEN